MTEKLAGTEGDLDELIGVELGKLGCLLEWRDKVSAVGHFLCCVDNFLRVEPTTVLFEDAFENCIVRLSGILPRSSLLVHRLPNFVRLLEGLNLVLLGRLDNAARPESLHHDDDRDAISAPEHREDLLDLHLDDRVEVIVTVLYRFKGIARDHLVQEKVSVEGNAEASHLMQVVNVERILALRVL